jgi:hypothetical protein
MADGDAALEPRLDLQFGDVAQGLHARRPSSRPRGNRRQPARGGLREEALYPVAQVGHGVGDHAQDAALGFRPRGRRYGRRSRLVRPLVAADQAHGLQVDPVGPIRLKLPEDGPGDVVLRRHGVEMRADRAGAMGIGRAQREGHARAQVLRAPARGAVGADGGERAHETAVGVGLRGQIWPLSRWVCMSTKAGKTIAPPMSTAMG